MNDRKWDLERRLDDVGWGLLFLAFAALALPNGTAEYASVAAVGAAMLGLNAVRCYDLDLPALEGIAAEVGPRPTDLHQDPDLRTPAGAIREARWWFEAYGIDWPDA